MQVSIRGVARYGAENIDCGSRKDLGRQLTEVKLLSKAR